jgi:hypothetical protein
MGGSPSVAGMAVRHRPRYALHLLWSIPLAAALAILPFFFGTIGICGVSGCGGGGFGPAYGPDYEWISPFVIVGLLFAAAIALVPWQRWAVRLAVGLVVGGGLAVVLISSGLQAKYA